MDSLLALRDGLIAHDIIMIMIWWTVSVLIICRKYDIKGTVATNCIPKHYKDYLEKVLLHFDFVENRFL